MKIQKVAFAVWQRKGTVILLLHTQSLLHGKVSSVGGKTLLQPYPRAMRERHSSHPSATEPSISLKSMEIQEKTFMRGICQKYKCSEIWRFN